MTILILDDVNLQTCHLGNRRSDKICKSERSRKKHLLIGKKLSVLMRRE